MKEGNVVKLKSSDIKMTIEGVNAFDPNSYNCVWFDDKNTLHRDSFHKDSLEFVSE